MASSLPLWSGFLRLFRRITVGYRRELQPGGWCLGVHSSRRIPFRAEVSPIRVAVPIVRFLLNPVFGFRECSLRGGNAAVIVGRRFGDRVTRFRCCRRNRGIVSWRRRQLLNESPCCVGGIFSAGQ